VCLKCGPSRRSTNPPSHPEAAKDARSTTDDPAQDRWQRLVAYLRDCVTAEATGELVRYEDATRWSLLDLDEESLICGTADTIVVGEGLAGQYATLSPGRALRYGWPLALLPDRRGELQVVPLLVTDLDMPSGDPPEVVAIDDEPYLNPGLLGGNLLDSATASELAAHVAGGIPFGDAVAMSQFVTVGVNLSETDFSLI
jgi:hypothetical protein